MLIDRINHDDDDFTGKSYSKQGKIGRRQHWEQYFDDDSDAYDDIFDADDRINDDDFQAKAAANKAKLVEGNIESTISPVTNITTR